jgi:hypothetical protein
MLDLGNGNHTFPSNRRVFFQKKFEKKNSGFHQIFLSMIHFPYFGYVILLYAQSTQCAVERVMCSYVSRK